MENVQFERYRLLPCMAVKVGEVGSSVSGAWSILDSKSEDIAPSAASILTGLPLICLS